MAKREAEGGTNLMPTNPSEMLAMFPYLQRAKVAVHLQGPPGVGKTDIVYQFAEKIKARCYPFHLVYRDLVDMMGMVQLKGGGLDRIASVLEAILRVAKGEAEFEWTPPTQDAITRWARTEDLPWYHLVGDAPCVLFLDELAQAQPGKIAAATQLLLEGRLGSTPLGPNTFVISAGNRIEDRAAANEIPSHVRDRVTFFEILPDFERWKWDWAIPSGKIHEDVLGFLNFTNNHFYSFIPERLANCTPRGWERTSRIIESGLPSDFYMRSIGGTIGIGVATEFVSWMAVKNDMPDIEAILKGQDQTVPQEPSVLSATCSSLVFRRKKLKFDEVEHILKYGLILPDKHKHGAEYSVVLVKDLIAKEPQCTRSTFYRDWAQRFDSVVLGS